MAKVHNNERDVQGIKLFGKTIAVPEKQEKDEHPQPKKPKEDEENDDENTDKRAEKIIACPRCKSMETKFCYFNNYNVNQPRHFCKGCQRYWTAGGALRNVPVGAGRRKIKPPCLGGVEGLSEGCNMFEHVGSRVQPFDVVVEGGHFQHVFPEKRRRC